MPKFICRISDTSSLKHIIKQSNDNSSYPLSTDDHL